MILCSHIFTIASNEFSPVSGEIPRLPDIERVAIFITLAFTERDKTFTGNYYSRAPTLMFVQNDACYVVPTVVAIVLPIANV